MFFRWVIGTNLVFSNNSQRARELASARFISRMVCCVRCRSPGSRDSVFLACTHDLRRQPASQFWLELKNTLRSRLALGVQQQQQERRQLPLSFLSKKNLLYLSCRRCKQECFSVAFPAEIFLTSALFRFLFSERTIRTLSRVVHHRVL
jgi:hypothetical protein